MKIRTGAVHTAVLEMPMLTSGKWLCCVEMGVSFVLPNDSHLMHFFPIRRVHSDEMWHDYCKPKELAKRKNRRTREAIEDYCEYLKIYDGRMATATY